MLYSGLCRNWDYVVRDYVPFRIMLFGIMFLGIIRIRDYAVWDYVAFGIASFGIVSFLLMSLGFMSFGTMSFDILSVHCSRDSNNLATWDAILQKKTEFQCSCTRGALLKMKCRHCSYCTCVLHKN